MGCGGSAERNELRREMKAARAQPESALDDRQGDALEPQEGSQSLAEGHCWSQLPHPTASPDATLVTELQLPGAALKERDADERDISKASTADSGGSQTGCLSESLPIRAWYPDNAPPPPQLRRRSSRCITEASPFACADSCDARAHAQITKGGFKTLRFSLDASDAPLQPSVEETCEPPTQAAPSAQQSPQRRSRRACTESWGGNHSEAAEAAGTWTRRRSSLLAKAGLAPGRLAVEKLAVVEDPVSPKRHRGRCRTRPSTWDAKDLEMFRKRADMMLCGQSS